MQSSKENKKIQEIRDYYENIIAKMPGHIFWKDRNAVLRGCNDQQANTIGLKSRKEVVGKTNYDMVVKNQLEEEKKKQAKEIDQIDFEVMETGTPRVVEEPLVLPDGSTRIYLSNKSPMFNEEGEVIGLLGMAFDITEQKNTEKLKIEKEEAERNAARMRTLVGTVAHELRTPLASIQDGVTSIQDYLPDFFQAYHLAKKSNLPVKSISPRILKMLDKAIDAIDSEITSAFLFIDMLLANVYQEKLDNQSFVKNSIAEVIEEALDRYPLTIMQKQKILVDLSNNFNVRGNKELLIHLLFNLLKNSLYYIAAAGKGEITISLDKQKKDNLLHFKDTGKGISSSIMPHIFERFFSKTLHGTGLGLSFCKEVMLSLGGDITCHSIEGEYTEFILNFPKAD